jgi:hypothetical protein
LYLFTDLEDYNENDDNNDYNYENSNLNISDVYKNDLDIQLPTRSKSNNQKEKYEKL